MWPHFITCERTLKHAAAPLTHGTMCKKILSYRYMQLCKLLRLNLWAWVKHLAILLLLATSKPLFKDVFWKYQCGFRKGYSARHCLLVMTEKWKKIVDYGGVFGALWTDLSKAFDCIPPDLFTPKLEACGFQTDALNLVYDYLSNRKQRVKINETFSCWKNRIWCSTRIYPRSTIIQYTFMWLFSLPWRSRYCKLSRWHNNIRS